MKAVVKAMELADHKLERFVQMAEEDGACCLSYVDTRRTALLKGVSTRHAGLKQFIADHTLDLVTSHDNLSSTVHVFNFI